MNCSAFESTNPAEPTCGPPGGFEVSGVRAGRAHRVILLQLLDQLPLGVTAETGLNDGRIVGPDCLDDPIHRGVADKEEHRSPAGLQRSSDLPNQVVRDTNVDQ